MKCNKYENLFTFSDKDELMKHINECDDCKKEHEKMEKVSSLLNEVKLYYYSKKKRNNYLVQKTACIAALFLVSIFTYGAFMDNEDILDTLKYGNTLSAEELGFPVDSYGFIMVDE